MIDKDVRKKLIDYGYKDSLKGFEEFYLYHDKYQMSTIEFNLESKCSQVGYLAMHLLQNLVFRSRALCLGWIDGVNSENVICINLLTRAHFEVTGSISYLYKILKKRSDVNVPDDEIKNKIIRLNYGSRLESSDYEPIPVMTLINEADKQFKILGNHKNSHFRMFYNFLSEYSHPNHFGMTVGIEYSEELLLNGEIYPSFKKDELEYVFLIENSLKVFWLIYAKCLECLIDNENAIAIIASKNFV